MKLFFLHGMGGSPADAEALARHIPVEPLPIPRALGFDQAADALATLLRQEKEPFALAGYSMGGRLALRAAGKAGEKLKKLALVSTGLGFADEKIRAGRLRADAAWADLARQDPALFWKKWYAQDLFASFRELPEKTRNDWLSRRLSIDIEQLSNQFRLLSPGRHGDLTPELLRLKAGPISVLYIAGERDKKYAETARSVAERGVATELLPGGHILPLERPRELAECLGRWMAAEPTS